MSSVEILHEVLEVATFVFERLDMEYRGER